MATKETAIDPEGPAHVNAIDMVGTAAPMAEIEEGRFVVRPIDREGQLPSYRVFDIVDERWADGPFEFEEDATARAYLVAVHKAREVK